METASGSPAWEQVRDIWSEEKALRNDQLHERPHDPTPSFQLQMEAFPPNPSTLLRRVERARGRRSFFQRGSEEWARQNDIVHANLQLLYNALRPW